MTAGLMTSFSWPDVPDGPTVNPVMTLTTSGDINNMSTTWTLTDGGTVVMYSPMNMIMPNDAGTIISFMSDTLTFTYSTGGYSSSGYSSGYAHLKMTDVQVNYSQFTAFDGTGYTDVSTTTTTSQIDDTYSDSPTSSSANYSDISNGSTTQSDSQRGLSSLVSGGMAVENDSTTSYSNSSLIATLSNGATSVTYGGNDNGKDSYQEQDGVNSAADTENDLLSGGDNWSDSDSGAFSQTAAGVATGTYASSSTTAGNDLYSDAGMQIARSASPNGDGMPGGTFLIEATASGDIGADRYTTRSAATSTLNANGTITGSDSHDESDSGTENVISADGGLVGTSETDPDGSSTAASDAFYDANTDASSYGDDDDGGDTLGGRGGSVTGGNDESDSHDDDSDTFSSGDASKVAVTSVDPAGAVTSVAIGGSDSDFGTAGDHDDIEDDETVPTATNGETDDFEFDDSAEEQDTATSKVGLEVSEEGLVAPGDKVDLTETIALGDVTQTTQSVDDPGTEDDTPAGDEESDDLTENSDVSDKLSLQVNLESSEQAVAADGTKTETDIDSGFQDNSQDDERDELDDEHVEFPFPSNLLNIADPASDDETFEDEENDTNKITGSDMLFVGTSGPAASIGALGQLTGTGTQSAWNEIGDDYTEFDSDNNDDEGEDVSQSSGPVAELAESSGARTTTSTPPATTSTTPTPTSRMKPTAGTNSPCRGATRYSPTRRRGSRRRPTATA